MKIKEYKYDTKDLSKGTCDGIAIHTDYLSQDHYREDLFHICLIKKCLAESGSDKPLAMGKFPMTVGDVTKVEDIAISCGGKFHLNDYLEIETEGLVLNEMTNGIIIQSFENEKFRVIDILKLKKILFDLSRSNVLDKLEVILETNAGAVSAHCKISKELIKEAIIEEIEIVK